MLRLMAENESIAFVPKDWFLWTGGWGNILARWRLPVIAQRFCPARADPRDVALGQERVERDQKVESSTFLLSMKIHSNTKQPQFQRPNAALCHRRMILETSIGLDARLLRRLIVN